MAFDDATKDATDRIDLAIRISPGTHEDFAELAMEDLGFRFAPWYGRLLTNLTVMAGTVPPVYGQAMIVEDNVDIVLVTEKLVIVGRVSGVPSARATSDLRSVPRSAIKSLEVDATMPVNDHGRSLHAWPGILDVTAYYDGLDVSLRAKGNSYDHGVEGNESSLLALTQQLRADLERKDQ